MMSFTYERRPGGNDILCLKCYKDIMGKKQKMQEKIHLLGNF